MAHLLNVHLMKRIRKYGAFDVSACFNCGNCTAVCPLAKDDDTFPRRLIRYAQVGMEDKLLAEKDLWLCYYCGECSETCPRQAEPGEFMAAARRWAIARADFTGLARFMYGSVWKSVLVFLVFSLFFTLLLLSKTGGIDREQLRLFTFLPGEFIHDLGVAMIGVIGLATLGGMVAMVSRFISLKRKAAENVRFTLPSLGGAALAALKESLGQMRYRECDAEKTQYPWHLKPWFLHAVILWGFLGMLMATILDFLLKEVTEWGMPILDPMRVLGTISGVLCLYGMTVVVGRRITRPSKFYSNSRFSDWFFLLLLFATVLTGFLMEIAVYSPPSLFSYLLFLVHVVLALDLLVLMPLTKFSHAVYRPLALFLHEWHRQSTIEEHPDEEEFQQEAA